MRIFGTVMFTKCIRDKIKAIKGLKFITPISWTNNGTLVPDPDCLAFEVNDFDGVSALFSLKDGNNLLFFLDAYEEGEI